LRWRHLQRPVLLGHATLRYGRWLVPAWGLQFRVGAEFGEAGRTLGEVRVVDALAGAAASFRSPSAGLISFQMELGGDAMFQHLAGRSAGSDVKVDTALGITGQVSGAMGVTVRGARVFGTLVLDLGYVFRGPVASIEGAASVRADGLMLGATVRLGLPL
jgi:hypothetical protein